MIDPHLAYGSRPQGPCRLDRWVWDKMVRLLCDVNGIVLYRCDGVSCAECQCEARHINRCPTCGDPTDQLREHFGINTCECGTVITLCHGLVRGYAQQPWHTQEDTI